MIAQQDRLIRNPRLIEVHIGGRNRKNLTLLCDEVITTLHMLE